MIDSDTPAEPGGEPHRLFFDAVSCPAWMFDARTLRIVGVNRAALDAYGFSRGEFLRMTVDQLAPETERPTLKRRLRAARAGAAGAAQHHLTRSGSLIEVRFRWVRASGADRQADRSLAWAERLPGADRGSSVERSPAFDQAPVALLCLDHHGRVLDANAAAAALLRHPQAPLAGRQWRDLTSTEATDGTDVLALVGRDGQWRGTVRLCCADGAIVDAEGVIARASLDLVIVALQDVSERTRTEGELRRSNEKYRRLSDHARHVREEERASLSRDLHDRLGQALTGLKMDLAWLLALCDRFEPTTARAAIVGMMDRIDTTIGVVRRISGELRPGVLDRFGLQAAIEWRASEFERRGGVRCRVSSTGAAPVLDHLQSTELFRVFEELLTNVTRHAQATRVRITMKGDRGKFALHVYDNGRGIPQPAVDSEHSLGLIGMRERATLLGGTLIVSRGRRRGTLAVVRIPLKPRLVEQPPARRAGLATGVTEHDS